MKYFILSEAIMVRITPNAAPTAKATASPASQGFRPGFHGLPAASTPAKRGPTWEIGLLVKVLTN